MPLKIQITDNTNLKGLSWQMRNQIRKVLQRELPKAARGIVERTQSGRDIDGNSFTGYSDGYAKAKRRALGSSSPVDLTSSGAMLGSIRAKTSGGLTGPVEASIEISDEKAEWHQKGVSNRRRGGTLPARPFFGLDKTQIANIVRAISDAILRR